VRGGERRKANWQGILMVLKGGLITEGITKNKGKKK
jgi:hypothetical protein